MAVCCQNLPLGALSSRSAPSMLVGELFKKFGLFLNTGVFRYPGLNRFSYIDCGNWEFIFVSLSVVRCMQGK
jgi:hypothetical protein